MESIFFDISYQRDNSDAPHLDALCNEYIYSLIDCTDDASVRCYMDIANAYFMEHLVNITPDMITAEKTRELRKMLSEKPGMEWKRRSAWMLFAGLVEYIFKNYPSLWYPSREMSDEEIRRKARDKILLEMEIKKGC